jgi:hypothetical protein
MPDHYSTIRMTISWIVFGQDGERFGGFCRFKVRLMNVAAGAKLQKNAGRISFLSVS